MTGPAVRFHLQAALCAERAAEPPETSNGYLYCKRPSRTRLCDCRTRESNDSTIDDNGSCLRLLPRCLCCPLLSRSRLVLDDACSLQISRKQRSHHESFNPELTSRVSIAAIRQARCHRAQETSGVLILLLCIPSRWAGMAGKAVPLEQSDKPRTKISVRL